MINNDKYNSPMGIIGPINCLSGNYNDKGFNLDNGLGYNLNINLDDTNPHFTLYNNLIDYYSYIEMTNNIGNQGNLFTTIGFYMINNNKFLNIEDSYEIKNCSINLNINSLLFDDNHTINSKYTSTEINLNNIIGLNLKTITFKDSSSNKNTISQYNNQIIFNNISHLDTGMIIINSLKTFTVYFTNPYPEQYIPTVILQQYNSLDIIPFIITNITNNNFTWYSKNLVTCTLAWIAF
jgi:hypothetical protein